MNPGGVNRLMQPGRPIIVVISLCPKGCAEYTGASGTIPNHRAALMYHLYYVIYRLDMPIYHWEGGLSHRYAGRMDV